MNTIECLSLYYDIIIAFPDFLDECNFPWTFLGWYSIAAGIFGVQALGSNMEWPYGRCVKNEDSAEGKRGVMSDGRGES